MKANLEIMEATRAMIRMLVPGMTKEELLAFKAHYTELLVMVNEALEKQGVKSS